MASPAHKNIEMKTEMDLWGHPVPPRCFTNEKIKAQRNYMSFPELQSLLLEEVGLDLGFPTPRLSAFIVNVPFDKK